MWTSGFSLVGIRAAQSRPFAEEFWWSGLTRALIVGTIANMTRHITITLKPDWQEALRASRPTKAEYQGEVLNFETPGQLFGRLTEKRWAIIQAAQGKGEIAVRELARAVGRDVKRVHEDVIALADLGLLERTQTGGLVCPFSVIHIDMQLRPSAP